MDGGETQETNTAVAVAEAVQSEQEFKCLVQQDDGHTIPAKIYSGYGKNSEISSSEGAIAEMEMQAEAKRTELKKLILDHQELVFYIGRLESPENLLETTIWKLVKKMI